MVERPDYFRGTAVTRGSLVPEPEIAAPFRGTGIGIALVLPEGRVMKLLRRQFLHLAAGAAALPTVLRFAWAQTYPTRPMTMIVPFAAGGPQDVLGRLMAQRMSEILGKQIVVENIGGAGGVTGSKRVADAQPDGYTMGIGSVGTHAHNQTLYKRPAYDAAADFTPVALIAETPSVLITRKDLPANSFQEFVAYTKEN